MLLVDRNFNSFALSNKQAHIISGNLPELRYGELSFSLTQVSRFSSYTKELLMYMTDNRYFCLLMFQQIRYVH